MIEEREESGGGGGGTKTKKSEGWEEDGGGGEPQRGLCFEWVHVAICYSTNLIKMMIRF